MARRIWRRCWITLRRMAYRCWIRCDPQVFARDVVAHLRALLPDCRVMTNEDLGLDGNAKEAVAFALLADETIFASCNNAPGATGARHPVVMGKISL